MRSTNYNPGEPEFEETPILELCQNCGAVYECETIDQELDLFDCLGYICGCGAIIDKCLYSDDVHDSIIDADENLEVISSETNPVRYEVRYRSKTGTAEEYRWIGLDEMKRLGVFKKFME